jgi:hypothetical protein
MVGLKIVLSLKGVTDMQFGYVWLFNDAVAVEDLLMNGKGFGRKPSRDLPVRSFKITKNRI